MPRKSLDLVIEEMRNLGNHLIPYNYPLVPQAEEDDIGPLKVREVTVDGYSLLLHYCKSDYDTHLVETLQVYGRNFPFLPFSLVCKLAQKFLGDHHLSLVELLKEDHKIYCWTVVVDRKGRPVPSPFNVKTESCEYDGLQYSYMLPNQVNFF